MNYDDLNRLFLKNFPYSANADQTLFFDHLSKFIFSKNHQAFILSGYAGTGKTTLVKSVVSTYLQLKGKIVLLAPTGRASKVLSQRAGYFASTIHRHIYIAKNKDGLSGFTLRPNKSKHTLYVVDEASMIADRPTDGNAFGKRSLLEDLLLYVANGHKCKILFIGDSAQLPPVGLELSPALNPETLFKEYSLNVAAVTLTQVIRQAQESVVLQNATLIRNHITNNILKAPMLALAKDVVRLTDPYDMEEVFQMCFSDSKSENGIMVVRSNKRANQYNQDIRARIQYKDDIINTTDQLMVVKNNYFWLEDKSGVGFIANGDTIEVLSLRNRENLYGFTFTDATIQLMDYPDQEPIDVKLLLDALQADAPALPQNKQQALFDQLLLEYAEEPSQKARVQKVMKDPYYNALQVKFSHVVTCHKAQGGQWPHVIIEQSWMPTDEIDKEYLRWLYTAFTRAQEKVYLIGFDNSYFEPE